MRMINTLLHLQKKKTSQSIILSINILAKQQQNIKILVSIDIVKIVLDVYVDLLEVIKTIVQGTILNQENNFPHNITYILLKISLLNCFLIEI